MNILLSEQLKKLRKQKENTQEDLANHLGISIQAVSKWERNEGYPDITLLPAIASYYNVSIDDLLGVGDIAKSQKLQSYSDRNEELFRDGKTSERIALWREAKKEFPNELLVIYELRYALSAEGKNKNSEEIIECGEKILEESTDNSMRGGAIQVLCYTYNAKGDKENAKKYANMAAIYHVSVNELMAKVLEGEEAVEWCQENIQALFDLIQINTKTIIKKANYTPEETIQACQFVIDCFSLLYPDGNYGFHHCRIADYYLSMANNYRTLENEEKMFECLEKAAEHSIQDDTRKDGMYTAFMVNRVKMPSNDAVKTFTENQSGLLMKSLQNEKYAHWQNDPRMKKIIKKLKPIAIM